MLEWLACRCDFVSLLGWALSLVMIVSLASGTGWAQTNSIQVLNAAIKEFEPQVVIDTDPRWTSSLEESYRLRQRRAVRLRIQGAGGFDGSLGSVLTAMALLHQAQAGPSLMSGMANRILEVPFRDSWDSYGLRSLLLTRILLQFGDLVSETARLNIEAYIKAYFAGERNEYYVQYDGSAIAMYPMFLKTIDRPHLIEQTYPHNFSENHYLKFVVTNYFTGLLFPDQSYPRGPWARRGIEHAEYWRDEIRLYLDLITRYGFQERDSLGYYLFDAHALTLLFDFAPDPAIRAKAGMALDLLVADVARKNQVGVMGAPNMRTFAAYGHVLQQDGSPLYRVAWLLFGDSPEPKRVEGDNDFGSLEYSTYRPPSVLVNVVRQRLLSGSANMDRKRRDILVGDEPSSGSRLYSFNGDHYMMGTFQQIDDHVRSQYQSVPWRLDIAHHSYRGVVLATAGTPSQGIYSGSNVRRDYRSVADGKYRFPMWSTLDNNEETGLQTDGTFFQEREVLLSQYRGLFRTAEGTKIQAPTVVYIPSRLDMLDTSEPGVILGQLGSVFFGLRAAYGNMRWLARSYPAGAMPLHEAPEGFSLVHSDSGAFWESGSVGAHMHIKVEGFGPYELAYLLEVRANPGRRVRVSWSAQPDGSKTASVSGTHEARPGKDWTKVGFSQAVLDAMTLLPVELGPADLVWTVTIEADGPGVQVRSLTTTADPGYFQMSYLHDGDLLVCEKWDEVIAVEVGEASDYHDLEAFGVALLERPLLVDGEGVATVSYRTKDGDTIGFRWRTEGLPLVNGKLVDLDSGYELYSNPFMFSEWGSGLAIFADHEYALILDQRSTVPRRYWIRRDALDP